MSDIPKASSDVLRRNAERECGTPIGQVNVKLRNPLTNADRVETISFYCNKPRLHTDACEFVGADVVVRGRRRVDASSLLLRSGS